MRTRNSIKRASLQTESQDSGESPEKILKTVESTVSSQRRISNRRKPKGGKNISFSDKGYGGSSSDDEHKKGPANRSKYEEQPSNKRKSDVLADESSDSSSDDFLVPSQSIDLNSEFFKVEKKESISDFSAIENNIFAGINRLSESENSDDMEENSTPGISFGRHGSNSKHKLNNIRNPTIKKEEKFGSNDCMKSNGLKSGRKRKSIGQNSKKKVDCSPKTSVKNSAPLQSGKDNFGKENQQTVGGKQMHKIKSEIVDSTVNALGVTDLLSLGEGQHSNCRANEKGTKANNSQIFPVNESVLIKSEGESVMKSKRASIGKRQKNKIKAETTLPEVNKLGVLELLALGESNNSQSVAVEKATSSVCKVEMDSEEEAVSDWEEVDGDVPQQPKHIFPKEGIAVTVKVPNMHEKKKKKKGFDMAAYIKRKMNSTRRDIQVLMHKAHLLCWIAHGNYVNKILNSEILMGLSLSLIPSKHCYPDKHTHMNYLQQIVQWFSKAVPVEEKPDDNEQLLESLEAQFQEKVAKSKRYLVFMFLCVLRSLGINTRLVISLQPVSLKPHVSELCSIASKKVSSKKVAGKGELKKTASKSGKACNSKEVIRKRRDIMTKEEAVERIKAAAVKKLKEKKSVKNMTQSDQQTNYNQESGKKAKSDEIKVTSNSDQVKEKTIYSGQTNKKSVTSGLANEKATKSGRVNVKTTKSGQVSDTSTKHEKKFLRSSENKGQRSLRARKSVVKYIDEPEITTTDSEEERTESNRSGSKMTKSSPTTLKNVSTNVSQGYSKVEKSKIQKAEIKSTVSGSDSDYSADIKVKKRGSALVDRRVLSSDSLSDASPTNIKKRKDRCDVWAEVFLESEEKWICVDVYHRQIHCVRELYSRATPPVHYVLAWQQDGSIRDVSRRYCPQFHTVTRKHRVDEDWWDESLRPFKGHRTARDDQEDEDLDRQLQDRPLPTSLAEYKNHPLYVLKKDLLKFQGIYPPDAPTLGFVRGHPVYARECVHVLHSREIWLKEAKVVKLGETPYKIVKARPKWDRMSGQVIKDRPLEIFGFWQVEDYVPPPAVDGKVPRNAYGNVELFKPSMLPGGTVHMQIPGLNRVARKLQIDCAPAVTGFDYHCGACHPVYDGFIVCEEYKDVLAEAWQAEEEEADRRYEEKRLKRIYGNWRRLIKGLLIRERLKARYAFGDVTDTNKGKGKKSKKQRKSNKIETVVSDDSDWEMK